jgi:hypothetical protein
MPESGEDYQAAVWRLEDVDERRRHQLTPEIDEIELERRRGLERCPYTVVIRGGGGSEEAEREQGHRSGVHGRAECLERWQREQWSGNHSPSVSSMYPTGTPSCMTAYRTAILRIEMDVDV